MFHNTYDCSGSFDREVRLRQKYYDSIGRIVNKDKETMERYMQDSKYRSDIVFREVSFFAIDYLLN